MVIREREKCFEEVEMTLVNIAAIYGDFLIRYFGGEWRWSDDYSNFILCKIGRKDKINNVMLNVINMWKDDKYCKPFEKLIKEYGEIKL